MNTGGGNESPLTRVLTGLKDPGSIADFLEAAFDAVVAFDAQERITFWNPAAEQMFGWTTQEALGKTPVELFWPLKTSQEKKSYAQSQSSLKQGATLWGESRPCRKDGSSLWVQYTVRAIFDADGNITGYLALYRDISVQAQLHEKEEQLKRSNQKLNDILDSIQDDFYVLDHDWNFVYASKSFTSKVGKEPKDFIGNNIWQMFPKHVGDVLEENFRAAMEKQEIRSFEIPGKYTNAWYRMKAFPSTEGITVLGMDITDRRQAEEALRESEERYRQLVRHAPAGIYEVDIKTMRFIEVNDSMCRILGYPREELLSMSPDQLLDEEGQRRFRERMSKALIGEKIPQQTEYIVKAKNGREIWSLLTTTINYEDGTPRSISVIAHDITERKRAEEQLRELSQRLTYHVDNSPLAVIEWGPDMRLTRWSSAAERMFGWKAEEVLGKRMEDFRWIYDEDTQQVKNVSLDLKTGTDPQRFSANRNYRKDGSVAYCEWYNSSLVDETGNLRSILSLVLDVTERKRAEDALRENEKQLQLLNQSLEQKVQEKTVQVRSLASDVIKAEQRERRRISRILHDDLQQRVYAIQMQLMLLQDQLQNENETVRSEISDVEKQLKEMVKVTRQLSIDLSPPILPDEGLSHAIRWLAIQMRQQYGLSIEIQAEGPFAIPDEQLHVLLFNCVRELLFNVVKHAQSSQATVALQWSNGNLQIEVSDNGKGFAVDAPEQQAGEEPGLPSSLGLPTIRHQLSLFGGQIEIHPEPGTGTRVILTVPIAEHKGLAAG